MLLICSLKPFFFCLSFRNRVKQNITITHNISYLLPLKAQYFHSKISSSAYYISLPWLIFYLLSFGLLKVFICFTWSLWFSFPSLLYNTLTTVSWFFFLPKGLLQLSFTNKSYPSSQHCFLSAKIICLLSLRF